MVLSEQNVLEQKVGKVAKEGRIGSLGATAGLSSSAARRKSQISRRAATVNSLGREPQEIVVETAFQAPEGRHRVTPHFVSPLQGFPFHIRLFLGLAPQAIRCRPSGTKKCEASKCACWRRICEAGNRNAHLLCDLRDLLFKPSSVASPVEPFAAARDGSL